MKRIGWERVVVAACGPSLNSLRLPILARQLRGYRVIAVNDAVVALPSADALYACDRAWWDVWGPRLESFRGERFSSTHLAVPEVDDDKIAWGRAERFGITLVRAENLPGFGAGRIHYGGNSGFQAVNLALLLGATEILLAGFDMHDVGGRHRERIEGLAAASEYPLFRRAFEAATVPPGVRIVNCTPGSALTCFAQETL